MSLETAGIARRSERSDQGWCDNDGWRWTVL